MSHPKGKLVSYGMSDDWVNLGAIFGKIEEQYKVEHVDTDMTSTEQITHLLAEKVAPVMDIADIGYDFLGRLLDEKLAAEDKNASWDQINPATWNDMLKPEYKDMVCIRDPRVSTYATASVLAAALANGGSEQNVQPGLDWFKALRDGGNLREGVVLNAASIQKGECPISIVYDFDGMAKRDATGLPLQVVIPSDGTVGMLFAQYVSANAPHPNAAKGALDLLFSDEGAAGAPG